MFELFSQRIKNAKGEPEVFIYDEFPIEFRNQFIHILSSYYDNFHKNHYNIWLTIWKMVCELYSKEKGLKNIDKYGYINNKEALEFYIDNCNHSASLDLLDFVFSFNYKMIGINEFKQLRQAFNESVKELSYRLKQHNLGYEFVNGEIIIKTNTVAHENIIKPALKLLLDEDFRGAEEEYLKAFDYYKKSENKNAILEAIKAFESTMKTICGKLGYAYDKNKDTASKLINILETNHFYPLYLSTHITGIRTTLESGAPTLRNKNAAHGQGTTVVNVSNEFAEYALNLVATNMILLFKIYKQNKEGGA
jgi:hypothetical protein